MSDRTLHSISPDATPEEVAAIVAALSVVEQERAAAAAAAAAAAEPEAVDAWRLTNRLAHRRGGMTRGPWRLSGRVRRRTRA